jgi:isopenicillin-N epimerase
MMDRSKFKALFLLNPEITYLNFGSFGGCPRPIFEDYGKWQLLLESEPVQYIAHNGVEYLRKSRAALGAYIGCDADDAVYVTNPTYAVNIIAKSLPLQPGDEILATDIEYGAMDRTWNHYCGKAGATYVRQPITLPVTSHDDIVAEFMKGVTPRTKAIFISQITSSTALILPVQEICAAAKALGLMTIVDGAHVPGHIPLDLSKLEADIYTGACHKWMMTPKGCSFLYVKKEYQHLFDPLVVSWGYHSANPSHSQFLDYHQMQGTRDFSAFLTVPRALEFMKEHQWDAVALENRSLARQLYPKFCNLLGTEPLCPVEAPYLGQICSVPINTTQPEKLQRLLFEKYRIEIPVMRQESRIFIRYSVQAYNLEQDYDRLYDALTEIAANTDLINI